MTTWNSYWVVCCDIRLRLDLMWTFTIMICWRGSPINPSFDNGAFLLWDCKATYSWKWDRETIRTIVWILCSNFHIFSHIISSCIYQANNQWQMISSRCLHNEFSTIRIGAFEFQSRHFNQTRSANVCTYEYIMNIPSIPFIYVLKSKQWSVQCVLGPIWICGVFYVTQSHSRYLISMSFRSMFSLCLSVLSNKSDRVLHHVYIIHDLIVSMFHHHNS